MSVALTGLLLDTLHNAWNSDSDSLVSVHISPTLTEHH